MASRKNKPDEGAAGPETSLSPINKGECWEGLERLGLNTPRDNPLEEFGRAREKRGYARASDASDAKERAASATVTLSMSAPELEKDISAGTKKRTKARKAAQASAKKRKARAKAPHILKLLSMDMAPKDVAKRCKVSAQYVRRLRAANAVNRAQQKADFPKP